MSRHGETEKRGVILRESAQRLKILELERARTVKLLRVAYPSADAVGSMSKIRNPMTVGEAAHLAGVSPDTVRLWHRTGKLRALRTSTGVRLFERVDLELYLSVRESKKASREKRRGERRKSLAVVDSPECSELQSFAVLDGSDVVP